LDSQFRLLREELLTPLRDDLASEKYLDDVTPIDIYLANEIIDDDKDIKFIYK
jgi:hypothetical protein